MSQLFNFSFQTLAGAPDSAGAINKNQVVYAHTTQTTKTLLVLSDGSSRIANNTLATVKSGFGLVSIGTPTRVDGALWTKGEVLVNQDYLAQVYNDTSVRRVELNWPATAPIVFTTATTLPSIISAAAAADKGYAEFVCLLTQSGATAPTVTVIKNEISENVSTSYVSAGVYNLVFGSISTTLKGAGALPASNGSLNITLQNGNYIDPITTALWFEAYRSDDARIAIESYDGTDLTDGLLVGAMLQVRLYY